ncbi:MAG: protein translocase subunit SecF [Patescibacteria group bacterium]
MINLRVVKNRKIWLSISAVMMSISLVFIFLWGFNFGIDFTGGSLLEVKFGGKNPSVLEVRETLNDIKLESLIVQPTENNTFILKFKNIDSESYYSALEALNILSLEINSENGNYEHVSYLENELFEKLQFDSVGPSIGKELKSKSFNTMIIVLILIILYVALVFRKISKPVSSWNYGISAIIALFHDVLIVLGVFAFLGKFYGVEINTAFIAAILTLLGYSVNDTIIVFDRIRENLPRSNDNFINTIDKSIKQVLVRSINTSFTTLLVLLSILFFGGDTIKDFVLALAIGIFIGTYSSIFISSSLLVLFDRRR